MAKKTMKPPDLAILGAQYRDARAGVTTCRREQAKAELELSRLMRANPGREEMPEVIEARERVTKAHRDVRWCQAVVIAAGEAFKGCRFDEVPNHRPNINVAETLTKAQS